MALPQFVRSDGVNVSVGHAGPMWFGSQPTSAKRTWVPSAWPNLARLRDGHNSLRNGAVANVGASRIVATHDPPPTRPLRTVRVSHRPKPRLHRVRRGGAAEGIEGSRHRG